MESETAKSLFSKILCTHLTEKPTQDKFLDVERIMPGRIDIKDYLISIKLIKEHHHEKGNTEVKICY